MEKVPEYLIKEVVGNNGKMNNHPFCLFETLASQQDRIVKTSEIYSRHFWNNSPSLDNAAKVDSDNETSQLRIINVILRNSQHKLSKSDVGNKFDVLVSLMCPPFLLKYYVIPNKLCQLMKSKY